MARSCVARSTRRDEPSATCAATHARCRSSGRCRCCRHPSPRLRRHWPDRFSPRGRCRDRPPREARLSSRNQPSPFTRRSVCPQQRRLRVVRRPLLILGRTLHRVLRVVAFGTAAAARVHTPIIPPRCRGVNPWHRLVVQFDTWLPRLPAASHPHASPPAITSSHSGCSEGCVYAALQPQRRAVSLSYCVGAQSLGYHKRDSAA